MKTVITGISRISSDKAEAVIRKFSAQIKEMRLFNNLDILTTAAIGSVLENAGINFPVGKSDMGLYIGIDDALEDIKDEYFENVLKDGIWGASPLLFPFTSPNALSAQAAIAFDIRGECITMPVKNSFGDVIKYAAECISSKHTLTAIAGWIMIKDGAVSSKNGRYAAEMFFLEELGNAEARGAHIYEVI